MTTLFDASAVILVLFVILGVVDGLYLHLWRFRLHARPEARREHAIHTLRCVLFVAVLPLLFGGTSGGSLLWAGVVIAAVDIAIGVWDVIEEGKSRRFQNGLPRGEQALHIVLTTLHVTAIALSLLARPGAAWFSGADIDAQMWAARHVHQVAISGLLPGAVAITALHLMLLLPRFRSLATAQAETGGACA